MEKEEMEMCCDEQPETPSLLILPNEILLHIVRRLPRHDVFFSIAHTSSRLRRLVQSNLNTLRLFDVHCHVHIVDSLPSHVYRDDGTDPIITYSFTLFDRLLPDYKQKKRLCLRGNDQRYKDLHISHFLDSTMNAQLERGGYDVTVPQNVANTLLSYMKLRAMRFQVRKQCRIESTRKEDDFFVNCMEYCERICKKTDIKSLLLCSKNVLFPWHLSKKSLDKLESLKQLRSLTLENMTSLDVTQNIPISNLCSLQFRLDHRHRLDIENVELKQINGSILKLISDSSVPNFDFSAYAEIPDVVSLISSVDMCIFMANWRTSQKPWIIRSISFNSNVTIDEFRSNAYRYLGNQIMDVPYCRFQTIHRTFSNVALELSCYGNGNATQWIFRTGFFDLPN